MLKIGDFSKLSRVSIRMLRHYDEIGLLAPGKVDAFTGYRYYGEEQLPTIYRINALKEMGFGLAAMIPTMETLIRVFSFMEPLLFYKIRTIPRCIIADSPCGFIME